MTRGTDSEARIMALHAVTIVTSLHDARIFCRDNNGSTVSH